MWMLQPSLESIPLSTFFQQKASGSIEEDCWQPFRFVLKRDFMVEQKLSTPLFENCPLFSFDVITPAINDYFYL